jgi:dynamin family protein
MESWANDIDELNEWHQKHLKPFLEKVRPEKLADLDRDISTLVKMKDGLAQDFTACFLGNSGVGKSTLINALVGGSSVILPSGGIGPLTAQALTVQYGEQPEFQVLYHKANKFGQLIFGLEQANKLELEAALVEAEETPFGNGPLIVDLEDAEDLKETISEEGSKGSTANEFKKIAQLLITGNQDNHADLTYLMDSLYEASGRPRKWGTQAQPADQIRIQGIKAALELAKGGETLKRQGTQTDTEFLRDLRDHASGFLAPLIRELTVRWDSPLLAEGVALVDLPGVGIAGDVYRDITRQWIRERAEAIVLVVDHRGVTESVAELLRKTEFLNRLLFSADEPEGDPVLLVSVSKIDDIAESRYAEDRTRKKKDHLVDVCNSMLPMIREQIRQQLSEVWASSEGLGQAQNQVIENILQTLEVHPISAIQFRKFLTADDDDRSFITDSRESNIPRLIESLQSLAVRRRSAHEERIADKWLGLRERIQTTLHVVQIQWQEETRATEEAEKLRQDLEIFLQPLRKDFHVRQGQYRGFLKKAIPQRIEDLVATARAKSEKEIGSYLGKLGYAHWGTLRASVRRGGRFAGATDIDLPREFALRFEEPIAEAWSKEILKDIRRETKEYALDVVGLVEQVVNWAKEQGARVQPKLVEAQFEAIKADAKKLESVGREMVREMREEAKNRLIETVESPIRSGCKKFVNRNADVGPGVKNRILQLFSQLATEVSEIAEQPAVHVLTRLFKDVEKEILATLSEHQDPLDSAAEAIVASQADYIRRSDAQRKRTVLDELNNVVSACPISDLDIAGATKHVSA